jgi:hypothetical protein
LGVADYFTLEGRIFAYAAFTWTEIAKSGGKPIMEFRWFNGERLIQKNEFEVFLIRSPHYAWSAAVSAGLGPGECRVELYLGSQKLAQRAFTVFDSSGPRPASMGPTT